MSEPLEIEVIARGLMVIGSKVLLCRNNKHGYFFLPGGHVEFGETAAAALVREFEEECGLSPTVRGLGQVSEGIFHDGKRLRHEVNLVFHVEHPDNPGRAGPGATPPPVMSREKKIAFEWVDLGNVGEVDLRPESAAAWLRRLAASAGASPSSADGIEWRPQA